MHSSLWWGVFLFYNPVLSSGVHPLHQHGDGVCLRLLTDAPLKPISSVHRGLTPPILRHCSIFPTCCSSDGCNSLMAPSVCTASDWWEWAYEGRAARLYGDPGLCISPGFSCDGRLWECLWLQAWVVCQRGGGISMHLPLRCLVVMTDH